MSWDKQACVIAAHNTYTKDGVLLDYIKLASIAAERVTHYLKVPVYLITEDVHAVSNEDFGKFTGVIEHSPIKITNRAMIVGDNSVTYPWKNDARIDAYELTKGLADNILMIDADYMVASDRLLPWLHTDNPFIMFNNASDVTRHGIYDTWDFPSNDIPQRWATAMKWSHSNEADAVFETAKMVRDNYEFYALMLGMPKAPFRNDLAFSVASHIHSIPTNYTETLYNLPPGGYIYKSTMEHKVWVVGLHNNCVSWNHDIHVLNKHYAMSPDLMNHLRLQDVES